VQGKACDEQGVMLLVGGLARQKKKNKRSRSIEKDTWSPTCLGAGGKRGDGYGGASTGFARTTFHLQVDLRRSRGDCGLRRDKGTRDPEDR